MCGDELRFLLAVVHITTFICPYAHWPRRQSRVFQNPSKRRDKGDAKRLLAGPRSFLCSLIGRPGLVLDCPMVRLFVLLCSTPGRCCRLSLAGAGAKYELSSATKERYASLGRIRVIPFIRHYRRRYRQEAILSLLPDPMRSDDGPEESFLIVLSGTVVKATS